MRMGQIYNLLNILRPRLSLHIPLSRCWVNPLSIGFAALEISAPLIKDVIISFGGHGDFFSAACYRPSGFRLKIKVSEKGPLLI
jgi:hypothetical protein